jgi:hypothetical protein
LIISLKSLQVSFSNFINGGKWFCFFGFKSLKNLKIAKISPLFKSGDKSLPGNYRPISVLPILSKIFEKHVATHLYLYLSKYKLLHESQCGFRCKHACHTALTTNHFIEFVDIL